MYMESAVATSHAEEDVHMMNDDDDDDEVDTMSTTAITMFSPPHPRLRKKKRNSRSALNLSLDLASPPLTKRRRRGAHASSTKRILDTLDTSIVSIPEGVADDVKGRSTASTNTSSSTSEGAGGRSANNNSSAGSANNTTQANGGKVNSSPTHNNTGNSSTEERSEETRIMAPPKRHRKRSGSLSPTCVAERVLLHALMNHDDVVACCNAHPDFSSSIIGFVETLIDTECTVLEGILQESENQTKIVASGNSSMRSTREKKRRMVFFCTYDLTTTAAPVDGVMDSELPLDRTINKMERLVSKAAEIRNSVASPGSSSVIRVIGTIVSVLQSAEMKSQEFGIDANGAVSFYADMFKALLNPKTRLPFARQLCDHLASSIRFHLRYLLNPFRRPRGVVAEMELEEMKPRRKRKKVQWQPPSIFTEESVGEIMGIVYLTGGFEFNSDDLAAIVSTALSDLYHYRGIIERFQKTQNTSAETDSKKRRRTLDSADKVIQKQYSVSHGFLRGLLSHPTVAKKMFTFESTATTTRPVDAFSQSESTSSSTKPTVVERNTRVAEKLEQLCTSLEQFGDVDGSSAHFRLLGDIRGLYDKLESEDESIRLLPGLIASVKKKKTKNGRKTKVGPVTNHAFGKIIGTAYPMIKINGKVLVYGAVNLSSYEILGMSKPPKETVMEVADVAEFHCPLCSKLVEDINVGGEIACDDCHSWYHLPCLGLPSGFPKTVAHYNCPKCSE